MLAPSVQHFHQALHNWRVNPDLPTASRLPYSLCRLQARGSFVLLLENLHFRDSRADALTRMARKMDVITLARVSGHRDLRQLLDAYYRETAGEIAARI